MIYIHVPLCRSFCTYCGFYSEIAGDGCKKRYLDALTAEIRSSGGKDPGPFNTLYFGGGTPSVLDPADFRQIMDTLSAAGFGGPYEEFTIEVNPDDIVTRGQAYVEALLALGVSRFSVGIQSLDDGILRWMNRRHDAARGREALHLLRSCGVRNLSADLIFGLSQMTVGMWEHTIRGLLEAARPEHISAYQLSIEEGSALEGQIREGRYAEATDEQCRDQYDLLCTLLAEAGYEHYEVSNFALPGYRSRHNSGYWARVPYLGFGGGAHSFDGSTRSWNTDKLAGYLHESEILTPEDSKIERIMLSLRTYDGVDAAFLHECCSTATLGRLLSEGALTEAEGRIRIPEDRFFVSDEIIKELI